ncbi:hypothetical protein DQ04_00791150 [Trypanosoma grayi]|uniref:hypothetical protein n=1 Tax=Trypanosoma grayi TaxID=71804 RepID=UPI0004F4A8C8|nr:hypothetical protein DQ04_00791150 [Trypanosoma grayi]KEG13785.1 hypothetical protein DQ04_00791150 [Trypanosoma grayi]
MSGGKHSLLQSYTTALGTKAYILRGVPGGEGSEEGESIGVPCRSSHSLRKRRTVAMRWRPWRGAGLSPPAARLNRYPADVTKRGDDRCVKSQDNATSNISSSSCDAGLTANWARLVPTTVVVPPMAPPDVQQSSQATTVVPPSVHSGGRIGTGDTGVYTVMPTPPPQEPHFASLHLVPELPTTAGTVLLPTPPQCDPRVGVRYSFRCSVADHERMVESGFVFCPQCGSKVRYDAPVEFLPADCPATHEREGNKEQDADGGYCVLCGRSIIYRAALQKREGNTLVPPVLLPQLPTGVPEVAAPLPPSATLGVFQAQKAPTTAASAVAVATPATSAVTPGEAGDTKSQIFALGGSAVAPPLALGTTEVKIVPAASLPVTATTNTNESSGRGGAAIEPSTEAGWLPYPSVMLATSVPAAQGVDNAGGSPFSPVEGAELEKPPCASVPVAASAAAPRDAANTQSAAQQEVLLYTAGVPGVSCGLPHCTLCLHSVGPPLLPVASTQHQVPVGESIGRGEASVVVVHNHYYHKM